MNIWNIYVNNETIKHFELNNNNFNPIIINKDMHETEFAVHVYRTNLFDVHVKSSFVTQYCKHFFYIQIIQLTVNSISDMKITLINESD